MPRRNRGFWHGRALSSDRSSEPSTVASRRADESGAILILSLVFLVAVSLIVIALLGWVGTSLQATTSFSSERNVEYAATDAVNLAIQNTRFQFDAGSPTPFLNNPAPELCATYDIPNNQTGGVVQVYCSMLWQPFSANTRLFTYSACSYREHPDKPERAGRLRRQPPPPGHRGVLRLPGRWSCVALTESNALRSHIVDQRLTGQWLLRREHDPDQLAVEPRGSGHHLSVACDRRHDRGNDRDRPGIRLHEWGYCQTSPRSR